MQVRSLALCAGALVCCGAGEASAALLDGIIDPGRYQLCNHPDGGWREPGYGLILTDLYKVDGDDDRGDEPSSQFFTFDFEHPESKVTLSYDGDSIVIEGEVYGGRDIGNDWADDKYLGLYEVYFEYASVDKASPDDDLIVENQGDSGWIHTPLDDRIGLSSKSNGDFAFRLGDEDDDQGHRGWDVLDDGFGISGWGWLNHDNANGHRHPSDWLFTLKVPTPGSVALLLAATPLVGRRRRA